MGKLAIGVVLSLLAFPIIGTSQVAPPSISTGIKVSSLPDTRRALAKAEPKLARGLPNLGVGVFVMEVTPDGGFGKAGIKFGDIILRIGDTQIKDTAALKTWMEKVEAGHTYLVLISRSTEVGDRLVWKQQTIRLTAEAQRDDGKTGRTAVTSKLLEEHKEWEADQAALPPEQRPFELKGDRLGMTLEAFKAKYDRQVAGDSRHAPFCSDAAPDTDNPSLFYKAGFAKASVVTASTTFPFEARATKPVVPTLAGVEVDAFVYSFVGGKLYDMTVSFGHDHYGQVMEAMQAKYGKPLSTEVRTYQNAFGAKFDGDVALWSNRVSEIMVFERAGSVDQCLLVVRHKELSAKAEAQIRAANPPRTDDL